MTTVTTGDEATSSEVAESVHDRARRVVRAAGISQREFADRMGIDQTALSKALRGNRRLTQSELAAIAEVGGVGLRYLEKGSGRTPAAIARGEARSTRTRAEPVQADARRAQILEETAHLIARKGFHQVRIADIARACHTSTATLLYHFESKDEALRAALALYADRLHVRLDSEFASTADPLEKLRRLVEVQLPLSQDDVDEWSIWVQSWNEAIFEPALRASQRAAYTRWRETVVEIIEECQAAGHGTGADAQALASRFTAMVDGLALQVLAGTAEMTVDRMRDLLLDSFEPHLRLRRA